mmetsp:Transcript_16492/g.49250  ORF Transcript_16492/g.49250 Transcript_16492/m.49250 type:complete len:231 (-) Transcript_16492:621-1313(-)
MGNGCGKEQIRQPTGEVRGDPILEPAAEERSPLVVARAARSDSEYLAKHAETLAFCRKALRFSGRAFLALACVQTYERKAPACLDSFAYGVFLLDAARRVNRLLKRESGDAQEQLTAALESVAQCHSIFAWVTLVAVGNALAAATGARAAFVGAAEAYDVKGRALKLAEEEYYLSRFGAGLAASLWLFLGGGAYFAGKLRYWRRASSLGAEIASHKIEKVFSPRKKEKGS